MKRNPIVSMLALLLFVVPFCRANDDSSPSSSEPTPRYTKVVDDVHKVLTDVTTIEGWQKPYEITNKHGFTTQAAQLLWDSCKPQMFAVGATALFIALSLKRAVVCLSTAAGVIFAAKLCLDRYR